MTGIGMRAKALAVAVAAAAALALPAGASANVVVDWNARAETAIIDNGHQFLPRSFRQFAMVQGAVYDAVNAIDGTPYQPYLVVPSAQSWYSKDAAVAAASHRVLLSQFPDQQAILDSWYEESLAAIADGPAKDGGIGVGAQAADAMIAARVNDGWEGDRTWLIGTEPGQWRPLPAHSGGPGGLVDDTAWFGLLKPFMIPSAYGSPGPNPLTSTAYARDFNEVKVIGSATSTFRTPDQTDAAFFWHGLSLVWFPMLRNIAVGQRLDTSSAARMFAMADLAITDAAISVGNDKYNWSFWRPLTAIREADTDGNARTTADPNWEPLLFTAPFPEHSGGHSGTTSAITRTLANFFGTDRIAFCGHNFEFNKDRCFQSFSQARNEVNNARVWGGVHFRTADYQGDAIGEQVANYLRDHYFQPTG